MTRLSWSLFVMLTLTIQEVNSQSRNDNWVFSETNGINFQTAPPNSLSNGQIGLGFPSGTISDQSGNLLFYTDGDKIWNNTHQVMMNGTGIMGDPGQMLILPHPGNPDLYYIFSVDNYHPVFDPDGSFGYSIVDMNGDNGSGSVAIKNILLDTLISEKITATLHEDGNSYWIIVHKIGSNKFQSYLFTPFGLSMPPITSNVGSIYPFTAQSGWAQMQISMIGDRLVTWISEPSIELMQFFHFSNATGQLTDAIEILPPLNVGFDPNGMELSPNGQILYTTSANNGASWLHQSDLSIWDSITIQNSLTTIDSMDHGGSIGNWLRPELSVNGKVYIIRNSIDTIAAVNEPNILGASCDFERNALVATGNVGGFFPNQIHNYHDDDVGLTENPPPPRPSTLPQPHRSASCFATGSTMGW